MDSTNPDFPVGGLLLIVLMGFVYLGPGCIALFRSHPNAPAIFALNLLLGWTLLGWVASLVWSLTAIAPAAPAQRACPFCAEQIMANARLCKHCGREVLPPVR